MAKISAARLAKLQAANHPRMQWTDVLDVTGELTADDITALTKYFAVFVKHDGCVNCDALQGGGLMEQFLGKAKFTWGLAHGEGYCTGCGYPARAYHFDVGPIKRLQAILQYHPDELSVREKVSA